MYSHCHQMITQHQPKGHAVVRGHPEIELFHPTHASLKTAKFLPVGSHRGPILETWRWSYEPPPPPTGKGVHKEEKR